MHASSPAPCAETPVPPGAPRVKRDAGSKDSRWWPVALAGTVLAAIAGGVLLTVCLRSSAARPPALQAPAAEASHPALPGEGRDDALEALGSLTAANLYQSYLNIGLLADARESDVYTAAEAEKLLDSVTRLLDSVDRQLERTVGGNLKSEDREAVQQTRRLGAQLRSQAGELRAYWRTGKKEHAEQFQQARRESWTEIRELMGFD